MIPLLFGVQQFFEGVLWVGLKNPQHASWIPVAAIGFLIFAQLVWPVWVPLSTFLIEKNKKRKRWIGGALILGIALFLILGYRMIVYEVTAQIDHQHIFYTVGHFKSTNWWSGIFYLLPAAFPFVFSSFRQINYLGILMLLFFVISKVFYLKYMISVWCLFGAILSIYIFFILKQKNKNLIS